MLTFLELGNYGRLGNQMWQIASTIGISKSLDLHYGFPKWAYNNLDQFSHVLLQSDYWAYRYVDYIEPEPYYNLPKLDRSINWNLKGYFQSPKYFENNKELIAKIFDFGYRIPTNSTSIHIRRGDYVSLSHIHIDLSKTNYYQKALELFPKDEYFEVYSDDLDYAEQFLSSIIKKSGRDFYRFMLMTTSNDYDALYNMSNCMNHIIANSSFSWWAAYLGINPDRRVIAPSRWVTNENRNDRLVKEWEVIEI
jgi:hypothetical protein